MKKIFLCARAVFMLLALTSWSIKAQDEDAEFLSFEQLYDEESAPSEPNNKITRSACFNSQRPCNQQIQFECFQNQLPQQCALAANCCPINGFGQSSSCNQGFNQGCNQGFNQGFNGCNQKNGKCGQRGNCWFGQQRCPVTAANYAFLFDSSSQLYEPNVRSADIERSESNRQPPPPALPTEFQDVRFNTNETLNGWHHLVGQSAITCRCTGLYLISYTASFGEPEVRSAKFDAQDYDDAPVRSKSFDEDFLRQQPPGGGIIGSIIATINGVEVPGSQAATPASDGTFATVSRTFLVPICRCDVLKLRFIITPISSTTWGLVAGEGDSLIGIEPSVSITIVRIC